MSHTKEDFLAAIRANPDEDGPRLVYADWLEETGTDEAKAELIRVQCKLAKLRVGHPDYAPLQQQEANLLDEHLVRWLVELPNWDGVDWKFNQLFSRGLVEFVSLHQVDQFTQYAEQLFQVECVHSLRFYRVESKEMALIAESSHLAKVCHLLLGWNRLKDSATQQLAASHISPN